VFEIIEVPSGLGLLPQGVDQAPAGLLSAGLQSSLGAEAVHTVACPDPDPVIDDESGLMNVSGLGRRGYGHRAKTLDRFLEEHIRDTAITVIDLDDIRGRGIEAGTVDYHDPDGLSWAEVEHILKAANGTDRLVGAQIAIYNPTLDSPGAPLAARIVDLLAAALSS
jgi:hypothetical protein